MAVLSCYNKKYGFLCKILQKYFKNPQLIMSASYKICTKLQAPIIASDIQNAVCYICIESKHSGILILKLQQILMSTSIYLE